MAPHCEGLCVEYVLVGGVSKRITWRLSDSFFCVQAFDHILTAVEDIAGLQGYHHWRDK